MTTEVAVISVEGREDLTNATLVNLRDRGGLLAGGLKGTVYWSGKGDAPLFEGWRVKKFPIERPASLSLQRVFEGTEPGNDLLFLEDDVVPCRNALIAACNFEMRRNMGLISFYDYRCEWPTPGVFAAPKGRWLAGSQAVKFSAEFLSMVMPLIEKKVEFDTLNGKLLPWQAGWDTWMGFAVEHAGMDVYHYAPSLFQHGGATWSIANEGAGHPYALNFPGEDWDALSPCPNPIPTGSWTRVYQKCKFHGRTHPNGIVCRYWPIDYGDG